MKKLAVVFGMLLTFGLLLTSCGAKGPSYNPMTEADLEDTAWLKGTWQLEADCSYKFDVPDEAKAFYEALFEEDDEAIEEEKKEMIASFGADETGKLVIDDDNVDEFVSTLKFMLKQVCDEEETYEQGGAKVTSHVKSAIEVTDSKDSMQITSEESMSSEFAGYTVEQSYSGIVTFTKQ